MPQSKTIGLYARYVKKWTIREHVSIGTDSIPLIAVDPQSATFYIVEFDVRDLSKMKQTEFEELVDKKFFSPAKVQWLSTNVSSDLRHQRILVSRALDERQARVLSDLSIGNWNWRAMQAELRDSLRKDIASSDYDARFLRSLFFPQ